MPENRRDTASRAADRARRLADLAAGGYEQRVCAALRRLWAERAPVEVSIRWDFVRRDPPWAGAPSDNKLPPVNERPAAARLLSPRGVALRLYLTAVFAAACTARRGAPFVNTLPLRPEHSTPLAWSEIVAAATRQSPASANRQATPTDNRVRQLKSALDRLASDEVRLVRLGIGRGKYEGFALNLERSSEGMVNDVPYTVPRRTDETFALPAAFFLNGWQHALTGSEILAYLALHELRRLDPAGHAAGVRMGSATRIRCYGLSKDTYEDMGTLCAFGLVEADADPNRRPDGTVEGQSSGEKPMPTRYRLVDGALDRPAVETILG